MMQDWFKDAKLGIFIHWGIYAVHRRGGESWPIFNGDVSLEEYLTQMKGFTASNYQPQIWADLAVKSGVQYAVLTTKHHDGVTLWPTKENSPSIPQQKNLPDLIAPYVKAIRDKGLKVGLYFSHTDWHNLDHMSVLLGKPKEEIRKLQKELTDYTELYYKTEPDLSAAEYRESWTRFLDFHRAQLTEILTNYGDIDLIWFDVLFDRKGFSYECAELRDYIHSICPNTIINSRLDGHGDYDTPEQFIPVYPPEGPWELCVTTNSDWSYSGSENDYKTPYELITMLCECVGMGGNMLLNIGPDEHGNVPQQQVQLLETLGGWLKKHASAIYGTVRGLPHGYAYHSTAFNKAKDTLYLYLAHIPKEDTPIKGIRNDIKKITVIGNGAECSSKRIGGAPWMGVPGTLWIDIPKDALDPYVTVLKIELEGALDLHDGGGVEIDKN